MIWITTLTRMIISTMQHYRLFRVCAVLMSYLIGNSADALYNAGVDMVNSPVMQRLAYQITSTAWEIIKLHFNISFGGRTT